MIQHPNTQTEPGDKKTLHATCVALEGRGVLIIGGSGQGKSGLALQLIALGAGLVSDDRTRIWRKGGDVMADAPERLRGLIEAREVGILELAPAGPHPVAAIVDMDTPETDRLPGHHEMSLLGCRFPVLRKSQLPHFPAAIVTYLRGQRQA